MQNSRFEETSDHRLRLDVCHSVGTDESSDPQYEERRVCLVKRHFVLSFSSNLILGVGLAINALCFPVMG